MSEFSSVRFIQTGDRSVARPPATRTEVTFKQAQILSLAGDARAALAALELAVTQGFVCVACVEDSALLKTVRALPEYAAVRERARTRHVTFGRRFGLAQARR